MKQDSCMTLWLEMIIPIMIYQISLINLILLMQLPILSSAPRLTLVMDITTYALFLSMKSTPHSRHPLGYIEPESCSKRIRMHLWRFRMLWIPSYRTNSESFSIFISIISSSLARLTKSMSTMSNMYRKCYKIIRFMLIERSPSSYLKSWAFLYMPLLEEVYSWYQVELGKYLTGLLFLMSTNFQLSLVWLITVLSLPHNWLW